MSATDARERTNFRKTLPNFRGVGGFCQETKQKIGFAIFSRKLEVRDNFFVAKCDPALKAGFH